MSRRESLVGNSALSEALLWPLARTFGLITAIRNHCFDHRIFSTYEAALPVICIGNVVVGGSGKSPFTSYLCQELFTHGSRPVILSRGYGGTIPGPHLVSLKDSPGLVGDEALMHAQALSAFEIPVVIARRRSAGARFIEEHRLGDVIVLDDGFQHRRLHRELDVVLLDVSSEQAIDRWLHGDLLPRGFLRESYTGALRRADAVVFVHRSDHSASASSRPPSFLLPRALPAFQFSLSPSHLVDGLTGERFDLSFLEGKRAAALTAIATPEHFFAMVERLGGEITAKLAYRDHHAFRHEEWERALTAGEGCVLSTEKDAVKLRQFTSKPGQLCILALKARFAEDAQAREFFNLVQSRLKIHTTQHEAEC
ncbi:MAG: tetraacyldisaccharide 4'-kinase [Bdellovibrionales bacterium]|nr:tetraacyldisaccharide 4'-kinase [Bdellovibrionales bacterium]